MKPYTMEDYADEANKLPWMIDADRLKATILALEEAKAALGKVAKRQREACALYLHSPADEIVEDYSMALATERVLTTPLVTEE
jgi:hypothetical protein